MSRRKSAKPLNEEVRAFLGEMLADGWIHHYGPRPVARLRRLVAKLDAAKRLRRTR